jgi:hypothetical protein
MMRARQKQKAREISLEAVPYAERLKVALPYPMQRAIESK